MTGYCRNDPRKGVGRAKTLPAVFEPGVADPLSVAWGGAAVACGRRAATVRTDRDLGF